MTLSYDLVREVAKRMVATESRGNGDQINALERVAKLCGMSARSLRRIIAGEAKDVSITVAGKILRAEADQLSKLVVQMEHDLAIARARFPQKSFDDLEAELQAFAAKIQARKERIG